MVQTEIPSEPKLQNVDANSKIFITNWLLNRKAILKENLKSFYIENQKITGKDESQLKDDYLNTSVDGDLLRQVNRMNKTSISSRDILERDDIAEFDKQNKKIIVSNNIVKGQEEFLSNVVIHERTHSLMPVPQENAIKQLLDKHDVIKNNYYNKTPLDLDSKGEIYARLMAFRKENNLTPSHIVTGDNLKTWKKELKSNRLNQYPTNFLLDLFNTIASNDPVQEKGILRGIYDKIKANKLSTNSVA